MTIFFLAPGVGAPWTEGRKNLVRDLNSSLNSRGIDCEIIHGLHPNADRNAAKVICRSLLQLMRSLRWSENDVVAIFPYGRFTGWHGVANWIFLLAAKITCTLGRTRSVTVLYSAAGLNISLTARAVGRLAAVGANKEGVRSLPLGITAGDGKWQPPPGRPRVLFMAGYQDQSDKALLGVLHERGLMDLLNACGLLREMDFRLAIAIPFLEGLQMLQAMKGIVEKQCPNVTVEYLSQIDAEDELLKSSLFVFPYKVSHAVFVPHSLLEALHVGIPVIAADHEMYATLTKSELSGQPLCQLYRPGDIGALASALRSGLSDPQHAKDMATSARSIVRSKWTMHRCVETFLAIVSEEK